MVTLKNIKNRKIYDMLEHYIMNLCQLQALVVQQPAAINDREFYSMFLEGILGKEYTSLADFAEKNKDKFGFEE